MSRDLEFDGWWEGEVVYSCDCCHKEERFRFDSEDINSELHRQELRKKGWILTKVNGKWKDFCGETCRNKFIRANTF